MADEGGAPLKLWKGLVLLAAETILGYLLWSVWELFINQCFFFVYLVTGFQIQSLLVLLILVPAPLLAVPVVAKWTARYGSLTRLVGVIMVLLAIIPVHGLRTIVLAVALISFLVGLLAACQDKYLETEERELRIYGTCFGLALLMLLRVMSLTQNPLIVHPLLGVMFSLLGGLAVALQFVLQDRTRPASPTPSKSVEMSDLRSAVRDSDDSDGISSSGHTQPDNSSPNHLNGHEWYIWIFPGLCAGCLWFLTLFLLTSSEVAPRWVGWEDTFPANLAILLCFLVGIAVVPLCKTNIFWVDIAVLSGGLFAYLFNGGGYTGLCLLSLVIPTIHFQVTEELSKLRFLWPAVLTGAFVYIILLLMYVGSFFGGGSPLGSLTVRNPENWIWPAVTFIGLILVSITLRYFITERKKSFKHWCKTHLLPRLTFPPLHITIFVLSFLILLVPASVIRAVEEVQDSRPPYSESTGQFRIMTYNVFQGMEIKTALPRFSNLKEVIQDAEVDIVGLQESNSAHMIITNTDVVTFLSRSLDMRQFWGTEGARMSFNVAVLSAYQIIDPVVVALPVTTTSSLARYLTDFKVNVGGLEVRIFNIHMEFGVTEAAEVDALNQAQFINQRILDTPDARLIVMGDLNHDANHPNYLALVEGTGLRNAYAESHNGTFAPTFYKNDWVLDHILYRGIDLVDSEVLREEGLDISDHWPLVATFTL